MENNWRDDPITEGQIRMVKFINLMLGKNFHPTTKGEADDIIKAYQTMAQAEKDRREAEKAEKQKRIDQTQPIVDRLQGKKRNTRIHPLKKGDSTVVMDYAALKKLVADSDVTMTALNDMLGQNHSYLSQRHSQHEDKIPQSFVGQICNFLGCAPADFIPELRFPEETTETLDLIEQAEADTVNFSTGEVIRAEVPPVTDNGATNRIEITPEKITVTPLVGAKLTDRLQGFAAFTGRDLEEIVNTAVDAYLDNAMLMVAGM